MRARIRSCTERLVPRLIVPFSALSLLIASFGLVAVVAGASASEGVASAQGLPSSAVIAFAAEGNQIYVINVHRKRTRLLVRFGDSPAWSPDGKKMAYYGSYLDPKTDQYSPRPYVMNANGTHKRRLPVNFEAFDAASSSPPSWSPNGKAIAFAGAPADTDHIYVINADGSGLRQLTNGDEDLQPVWSPDGKQIAFARAVSNTSTIYVMNADGSDERELVEGGYSLYPPAWSPDGTKIAFTGNLGGVYVINADGNGEHTLSDGGCPAWSPDGTKIAFAGDRGGVYVMNADGSGQHKLAPGGCPVWSPDGTQIAFQGGAQFAPSNGIYVMNADGSARRQLNHLGYGGQADLIAWQPLAR